MWSRRLSSSSLTATCLAFCLRAQHARGLGAPTAKTGTACSQNKHCMQAAQASPVAQGPGPQKAPRGQPGAHLSRKRACAALPPLPQQALRTGCRGQASALACAAKHSPPWLVQGARADFWRAYGRRACGASAPCAAAGSPYLSPRLTTAAWQRRAGRTPRAAAGAAGAGSPAALCTYLNNVRCNGRGGCSRLGRALPAKPWAGLLLVTTCSRAHNAAWALAYMRVKHNNMRINKLHKAGTLSSWQATAWARAMYMLSCDAHCASASADPAAHAGPAAHCALTRAPGAAQPCLLPALRPFLPGAGDDPAAFGELRAWALGPGTR